MVNSPINWTDPSVRAALGLRLPSETVDQPKKAKTQKPSKNRSETHLSREWRLQQIISAVSEGHTSRLEIARCVGISKSPHFVSMLDELVEKGVLFPYGDKVGILSAWRYSLHPLE